MRDERSFVQVGGKEIIVRRELIPAYRVGVSPGTRLCWYSAWEATRRWLGGYRHHHVDQRTIPPRAIGRIGTSLYYGMIPVGPERDAARAAHVQADCRRAYAAICHAYPELAARGDLRLREGEIEAVETEFTQAEARSCR